MAALIFSVFIHNQGSSFKKTNKARSELERSFYLLWGKTSVTLSNKQQLQ